MRVVNHNSKGAGDAISALILFIAVIGISVGIIIAFQQFAFKTQDSLNNQQDYLSNKLKTQYIISNVFYNATSDIATIYVKNTGDTQLNAELLSFFIGPNYLANPTIVNADSGNTTRLLFPQNTIQVNSSVQLSTGVYEVRVVSEFGNIVEDTFYVE